MRATLASLVLAVLAACTPPPSAHPGSEWIHAALAGHPTLQAEMAAVPSSWSDETGPWIASTVSPFQPDGPRLLWREVLLTYSREAQLDIAAHEAGHVFHQARWFLVDWPSNGVSSSESFADCFATAVRGHPVAGHGGCVGDPAEAFRMVATTPGRFG